MLWVCCILKCIFIFCIWARNFLALPHISLRVEYYYTLSWYSFHLCCLMSFFHWFSVVLLSSLITLNTGQESRRNKMHAQKICRLVIVSNWGLLYSMHIVLQCSKSENFKNEGKTTVKIYTSFHFMKRFDNRKAKWYVISQNSLLVSFAASVIRVQRSR